MYSILYFQGIMALNIIDHTTMVFFTLGKCWVINVQCIISLIKYYITRSKYFAHLLFVDFCSEQLWNSRAGVLTII